jgi:hypothetical protein
MLSALLFPKGKKYFINNLLNRFYKLFTSKKPLVLFDACTPFHLEHFKNVIHKLSKQGNIQLAVISPEGSRMGDLKNVCFYNALDDFPLYKKAEMYISTEMREMPFWFECPSVFFGHGMGPKLNYQASGTLKNFDYIFSPCRPTYEVQINAVSKDKVIPLGMPILDDLDYRKEKIYRHFKLDKNKPIVIYAPSWCNNISKVSDIKLITSFLQHKSQFNIIVSPHPSLFNPARCDGKVFFEESLTYQGLHINSPKNDFTTLELVKASTLVISDISSILFEAMALKKIVFFDGNKALYDYCQASAVYDEVVEICPIPNWDNLDDQTIEQTLINDELSNEREHFINHYLFNNGNASKVFIELVNNVLNLK